MPSWQANIQIDRSSIRPLYLQVKEALEEWILSGLNNGTLLPGERLPSENELSEQLGLSSITIKRALDELRRQGLIQRIQGRGSFVGQPKMVLPIQHLFSLTSLARNYGMNPVRKVLEKHVVNASRAVARQLSISENENVIRLVRLRVFDGLSISVETNYLPLVKFPNLISEYNEQNSLYELMKTRYQWEVIRAEDLLSPVLINPFESKALEVPVGSLGILVARVGYSHEDKPIEYTKTVFRGDLCRFSFQYNKEDV